MQNISKRHVSILTASFVLAAIVCTALVIQAVQQQRFNEIFEPIPKVVDPGPVGGPPADAIVLFDGKDLSQWKGKDGEAKWTVKDGVMTVAPKTGDITTKAEFGDMQLHIEWATPTEVVGESQGRGNSGVFLMNRYEVQILDSYNNKTYVNGQAGSIYKQHIPLVNVSRRPGEWQTYDIIFHAPKFADAGKVAKRATVTVLHNNVLVQDNVEIQGETYHDRAPVYAKHADKQPIRLQDHSNPMRFRNIWVRPLN